MAALIFAFFGTNVDGFACFAAALALNPPRNPSRPVLAAAFAFSILLASSFFAVMVIGKIGVSPAWFGLLPAGIGSVRLIRHLVRPRQAAGNDWITSSASIFSMVLATGFDNVAVYAPLFALRPLGSSLLVAAAFLAFWILGCAILAMVAPKLSRVHALQRHLEPAVALLFITVGVEIVAAGGRV